MKKMKRLKTFEGLFSRIKEIGLSKYLIKYNVTNYNSTIEEWELGKHSAKWNSKDYEYLISANSKEEAREKFESIWYEKVGSFIPEPKLNILSIDLINDKETIGSFKNVLHAH